MLLPVVQERASVSANRRAPYHPIYRIIQCDAETQNMYKEFGPAQNYGSRKMQFSDRIIFRCQLRNLIRLYVKENSVSIMT